MLFIKIDLLNLLKLTSLLNKILLINKTTKHRKKDNQYLLDLQINQKK